MVAANTEETALGSAHSRFVESLPRKAIELRGAVALLSETPSAEGPREDMRRRLHALYASALVFRNDVLAQAVHEGIELLDAAREDGRPLERGDLDQLTSLVRRLPDLRGSEAGTQSGTQADPLSIPPPELDFAPRTIPPPSVPPVAPNEDPPIGWQTAGEPLLQRVLHVLLVPGRGEQTELIELLRSDNLRVTCTLSVAEALASVEADAPDLVLASEDLALAGGLVTALHDDPNTDFVPVVLFESAESEPGHVSGYLEATRVGADGHVTRPLSSEQLLQAIGRATGTLLEAIDPAPIGDVTLDELADRVAREVRRGLVDAVAQGRRAQLSFGEGADVLAAAYESIADLRAAVTRASGGQVAFEPRVARSGGPALVAPADADSPDPREQRLYGRRIVLAEDDTAIVLLLANLLRQQGATVHEFTDGREAREAAHRERPDLVITGARVPSLDGFSLCRELQHDPLLADVPVLLLPPKEQLLTRAREPSATMDLAREVAEQVIASAERLLRARTRIEAQLRQEGEVRGSLAGTGVIALLRSVRRVRPDARIRIRDAWNLFECELRDGRLAQVTRTASDGSFVRNERALPQLLGATAGRFSVIDAEGAMKVSFDGTLDEVLMRGARDLAGELDAVSGARLMRVARVVFDEDAYALLIEQTPRAVRHVIERLYAGDPPSKLLKNNVVDLPILEPLLLDMARRGALRGVIGSGGEDLVAEARAARALELPIELASPLSIVPPPPNPVISLLPRPEDTAGEAVARAPLAPPRALVPAAQNTPVQGVKAVNGLTPAKGMAPVNGAAANGTALPPGSRELSVPGLLPSRGGEPVELPKASPRAVPPVREPEPETPRPPQRGVSDVTGSHPALPERPSAPPGGRESTLTDAGELAAAAAEARRSRSMIAAWTLALLALGAVAFFFAREPEGAAMPEALGGPHVPPATGATLAPRQKGGSLVAAEENGFTVYDGILDAQLTVPADHALLVVEATPALEGAAIIVNDRELGAPPQKLSLPEGVHELAIKRGDAISYRFVSVHPGRTWVLRNP